MGSQAVNARTSIAILALALVAGAAGFGAQKWLQGSDEHEQLAEQAPSTIVFKDLEGRPRHLTEWPGKLILVNFWASWCAPCLKEMPLLVEAQQEFGSHGLQIIGPALDSLEDAAQQAKLLGVNYPIMAGDVDVIAAMDALGDELGALPFSVLVAPDGRIIERITGVLTREHLQRLIREHLPT
jgi:thiol-disulfide isomerase/thioredoxin